MHIGSRKRVRGRRRARIQVFACLRKVPADRKIVGRQLAGRTGLRTYDRGTPQNSVSINSIGQRCPSLGTEKINGSIILRDNHPLLYRAYSSQYGYILRLAGGSMPPHHLSRDQVGTSDGSGFDSDFYILFVHPEHFGEPAFCFCY